MDFFKDLNVVEILKAGAIGLGFLLALMSYNLIKKEQEKPSPSKLILNSARSFMLFSIILMLLGIVSEFIKAKGSLNVRLGNNEMILNELSYSSASSLDTRQYFVNSMYGFAFRKPDKDWSEIKTESGIKGLFKIMGLKSETLNEANSERNLENNPYGNMLSNGVFYYFENTASKTQISRTEESGNTEITALLKKLSDHLVTELDTSIAEQKQQYYERLIEYRKNCLMFDAFEAKEVFMLSIYSKDSLPDYLRTIKLPGFYTTYSSVFGGTVDKLAANQKQILAGTEVNIENVMMKDKIINFQNKKWMMFSENDKYFFVIEISYSPQISSSTDLWDDLQDALNSFTLLTD